MELSELSSTQSNVQHQSLLVNAQGDPLKINLQAVELEGRPKLVRTLRSSGTLVVSNAKEAAIILVDSTTESGKRLIRTWGHDASKVVLEYTWVRASLDAGRPLLQADNWGGAMTVDDGKPVTIDGVVVDEDELEEVEALVTKSPLPTPRVTPVDPPSQRLENTVVERSDFPVSRFTRPPLPGIAMAQPAMVGTTLPKKPMVNTLDDIPSAQSPPAPPATQSLPYIKPTFFVQPSQSQSSYSYAPFATQQLHPISQAQMMSSQPFPQTGLASFQPHQSQTTHAPIIPHTPLPSAQSPMVQTTSSTTSMNGVNLETRNLATIMTMMDVVRHMNQSSWFGQNQLSVSQPPINPTSTFSEQSTTPGPTPSTSTLQVADVKNVITTSRKHASGTEISEDRSATRKKTRIDSSHRPSDEMSTPPISRKRSRVVKPATPPPKRLCKGKQRALSSGSSEHSEVDELMECSDDSHSTSSSASVPARPRNVVAPKKHGEIFLSGSGQPLRFFVQVDLHGRHTVVTNIKKNKGKIVNNIADADYSILFTRSDTFPGLLNEAIALGKSPILAAFVADCVEEGALLDETDYIVESVAKVKALKRGRQNAFSIKVDTTEAFSQRTKSSPATGEGKKLRETPLTDKKSKLKQTPKSAKAMVENREGSRTSCSPTPPAPGTRQLMKNGRYLFTEVEDEYFLRLAKHHLACDPSISNAALVCKLHQKMPHHSTGSWTAHVDKKLRSALDDVRKRANIAKRKRDKETVNQNLSHGLVNERMPTKRRSLDTTERNSDVNQPNPSQPSQGDLEQQDFDAITQFFASGGGGDDDDDERVWQGLEKHQPCRSANSWPDYYATHQEQVYARIEELTKEGVGG